MKSALDNPDITYAKIDKELSLDRVAGPFINPPFDNFRSSPIGIVPKKQQNEWRLIHHLSYPDDLSVNDGIPNEHRSVCYASVQDAIFNIKRVGQGCYLAKSDIKSAFRLVPVHPSQYHLLGFKWDGLYYHDKCLAMGGASSCQIFEAFSTSIEWILENKLKTNKVHHILDDFLFVNKSHNSCLFDLQRFESLCENLGVPINKDKTEGPATTLTFAGIELDTIEMVARLPPEKIEKGLSLIQVVCKKKKMTLRQLQSIIGFLNFACSVILPGRPFLRSLIDLTRGVSLPHWHIRINSQVRADLALWESFFREYNGVSFFINDFWETNLTLGLHTDASSVLGFGAVFGSHWFHGTWNESWLRQNIAVLELYPIVIALEIWAQEFKAKRIHFVCDNKAVVDVLNAKTSQHKMIMVLLRRLTLTCLKYNILYRAVHIQGKQNVLPDLLSRQQVDKFKALAPRADRKPTPIPTLPTYIS